MYALIGFLLIAFILLVPHLLVIVFWSCVYSYVFNPPQTSNPTPTPTPTPVVKTRKPRVVRKAKI